MCHFRTQNDPFVLNKFFLMQTIIITFIYLLALFIAQNFLKKFKADPELWEWTIFGPKMVHLPQFFLEKIINIIFIYLLSIFILQNFKIILTADPELWGCTIFGPKIAHLPKMRIFSESLLISLVPGTHAYTHASDINLLLKYWRSKNTEISLAESHFWL